MIFRVKKIFNFKKKRINLQKANDKPKRRLKRKAFLQNLEFKPFTLIRKKIRRTQKNAFLHMIKTYVFLDGKTLKNSIFKLL